MMTVYHGSETMIEYDSNKQNLRKRDYITDNGSITGKDAAAHLGIMSFTKQISDMRRKGYPLTYKWEESVNRYGEKVRYKRWYWD